MLFKPLSISLIAGLFTWHSYILAIPALNQAQNQEINIGNGDDPKTLDPQKCNETTCSVIMRQLFEGLVKSDINGNIEPAQALSWKISTDGKIYTFYLRKNLKWSDGSKLTAHDYVYSFQRLVDPKVASEQASLLENVENAGAIIAGTKTASTLGVKAIDDYTFQVSLIQPTPILLENLKVTNTYPSKKELIEKLDNNAFKAGSLVSNGAFKLVFQKIGEKIVIERNKNYWNNSNNYINKATFFSVVDVNTEFRMYETGQLDMTNSIPVDQYKNIKNKFKNELNVTPFLASYYYIFNNSRPPFKDNLKLRTALSMAIDRNAIANYILGMGQKPLYDLVPYGVKGYVQNKPYWQNLTRAAQLAEAQKLYKESGYSNEKPLTVHILYNTNDAHRKIATAIASMWKQSLGVNAITENEEWKTMLDKRTNGDFEILRMGAVANINDPYDFFSPLRSFDPSNDAKYKNPKYDELMKQASKELNLQEREKYFEQAGKILVEENPIAPIYSYVSSYMVKSHVKNLKKDVMNNYTLVGVYLTDNGKNIN